MDGPARALVRSRSLAACVALASVLSLARALALPLEDEKIRLETPDGWRGETISLPPAFAPDMLLRGTEEIRFAPGMFDASSDSFFSYAFVFRLDERPSIDEKRLREELLAYYRGLARAVAREKAGDTSTYTLTLRASKGDADDAPAVADVSSWVGELDWVEPFTTRARQKLRLEIDSWTERTTERRWLFCSVSPAPTSDAIWRDLRTTRAAFLGRTPAATATKPATPASPPDSPSTAATASSPGVTTVSWPSFRGHRASGLASNQDLPDRWDLAKGEGIVWKTPVPGLAHSSPIVWGDRLLVTTAISSADDATFRRGLYGDGDASEDQSVHRWSLYSLDRKTGEVLFDRVAAEGVPKDRRHIKATHANATPATDGDAIVAFFGSEGLFAWDFDGTPRWKKDLGRLDAGAYDAPGYEWGNASSPIIFRDLAIVQCDTQGPSFVLAADLATGDTRWRAERDELPSWGTPTVCEGPKGLELVTNASNAIRAYDPLTGELLWSLGGSSKITAPTPVFADGLIIVASGRAPERPIFAIRPGARGDLTLRAGETTSDSIAWSWTRRGPYMPTPLVDRGLVYTLNNQGLFDCYELDSGREVYRQRIPHAGSGFSASPVAADGKIYLSSEDGDVLVIRAGRSFERLETCSMGEPLMATPAIAGGRIYFRTPTRVVAVGKS